MKKSIVAALAALFVVSSAFADQTAPAAAPATEKPAVKAEVVKKSKNKNVGKKKIAAAVKAKKDTAKKGAAPTEGAVPVPPKAE